MRLLYFSLSLLLICSCTNPNTNRTKLIHFVPNNTSVILKTSNFETLKSNITNSDFLEKLSPSNSYKNFETKLNSLSTLSPINDVLICLSKNETDSLQYTFITKQHSNLFKTDSLPNYIEETLNYKNKSIIKSNLNNQTFYSIVIDSVFIVSSSKEIIETSFNRTENDIELEKIYNTTNNNKSISVITNSKNRFIKSFFIDEELPLNTFTNYIAVDADINQDDIIFNGITKASDSSSFINVFKNTIPQDNQIQNITPANSDAFISFSFDDFNAFESNLKKFNKNDSIVNTEIFENINEIGVIYERKQNAVILNSIDVIATNDALLSEQNIIDTYRQINIYSFSNSNLFANTFSPLITFNKASKYCVVDNFFVFANSIETLQNIIANYQNKTTISERDYYKDIKTHLSDASSLLMVVNPSASNTIINNNFEENITLKLDNYKASAIQFVYDNNFAHINGIIKKSKSKTYRHSISEELNIKLGNDLLNAPQFVTNHRTKQKEIVVQDVNNTLYLISNKGKILWKKQLNGSVLGNIEQIDIYKNGRLQLVFATPHRVYVIDRNGNDVTPFPSKFNDEITQPLSVFDYDKNKNYRLLVTQGKNVLMYNTNANIVKGFTFKSANATIVSQPKHFRIGSKDYIALKTKSKLYILDRTGKTRVTPKTTNTFSNTDIFLYKNTFTTTTQKGNLISIDTRGNTSTKNLNLSENHHLKTTSKTLVVQSDNKLTIKSKTIELDYGSYTKPDVFYINDKIYVSITDLQSQKVYLYDSQAKLLPNFPVYGNASITLDNIDADRNLEFVTKGESNSIVLYQIN